MACTERYLLIHELEIQPGIYIDIQVGSNPNDGREIASVLIRTEYFSDGSANYLTVSGWHYLHEMEEIPDFIYIPLENFRLSSYGEHKWKHLRKGTNGVST